jgi:hypothetical protein
MGHGVLDICVCIPRCSLSKQAFFIVFFKSISSYKKYVYDERLLFSLCKCIFLCYAHFQFVIDILMPNQSIGIKHYKVFCK